jgi:predicted transcriptional regulator
MIIELTKTEKDILKDIAKGEKTIYDIAVKDKIAVRSTVSEAVKKLRKLGFIEVKREEPFPKMKENIKRYYGLTFRGLIYALKLEGIKLSKIPYWEEIVSSWIQKAKAFDSLVKVREKLKLKTEIAFEKLQSYLMEYVKQNQKQIESFLRHYDLSFSDDILVCLELHSHVMYMKIASVMLNRKGRREIEKMLKEVPEQFRMMFFFPEVWHTSMEMIKNE